MHHCLSRSALSPVGAVMIVDDMVVNNPKPNRHKNEVLLSK